MNTQNIKNRTSVEKINISSNHATVLKKHEDTCNLVKTAALDLIDSCISLNEETYRLNLVLLTGYLNELIAVNDGFYLTSTLGKRKS
jgi:hypothetical protein